MNTNNQDFRSHAGKSSKDIEMHVLTQRYNFISSTSGHLDFEAEQMS